MSESDFVLGNTSQTSSTSQSAGCSSWWTAASTVVLDNSRVLSVVCLLCIDLFVTGENC